MDLPREHQITIQGRSHGFVFELYDFLLDPAIRDERRGQLQAACALRQYDCDAARRLVQLRRGLSQALWRLPRHIRRRETQTMTRRH
jgi:hypothetical protein